jgi:hypothetical protein
MAQPRKLSNPTGTMIASTRIQMGQHLVISRYSIPMGRGIYYRGIEPPKKKDGANNPVAGWGRYMMSSEAYAQAVEQYKLTIPTK